VKKEVVRSSQGRNGRTHQRLHHLGRRLELKVEAQVDTRESFGRHEGLGKFGLDRRRDLVNSIQETLDLERRLRKGRTIVDLAES
jgi:hypothetical protein